LDGYTFAHAPPSAPPASSSDDDWYSDDSSIYRCDRGDLDTDDGCSDDSGEYCFDSEDSDEYLDPGWDDGERDTDIDSTHSHVDSTDDECSSTVPVVILTPALAAYLDPDLLTPDPKHTQRPQHTQHTQRAHHAQHALHALECETDDAWSIRWAAADNEKALAQWKQAAAETDGIEMLGDYVAELTALLGKDVEELQGGAGSMEELANEMADSDSNKKYVEFFLKCTREAIALAQARQQQEAEWVSYVAEDGREYYYNQLTHETTWDNPHDYAAQRHTQHTQHAHHAQHAQHAHPSTCLIHASNLGRRNASACFEVENFWPSDSKNCCPSGTSSCQVST
jgi:hypothetical protein